MELIAENDASFDDPLHLFFFYKISCKDKSITKCYVGKTINMKQRLANHKTKSKISELPLYVFIRTNGGYDNFDFDILHKCLCNEQTSLFIEKSLIKSFDYVLNIQLPYLGENGYYNRNKCREHYKVTTDCECGWSGSKMNLSKHIKTSNKHRKYVVAKLENQVSTMSNDIDLFDY